MAMAKVEFERDRWDKRGRSYVQEELFRFVCCLSAVPVEHSAFTTNLLLQLNHAVDEGLGSRRATRDVNVDGNNAIASTDNSLPRGVYSVREM